MADMQDLRPLTPSLLTASGVGEELLDIRPAVGVVVACGVVGSDSKPCMRSHASGIPSRSVS